MSKQVFWLQYLPAFVREKIEHRPNVLKVLSNTGWLFFDKILRMGVGLLVGVWIARYLGPEQFGLLNFAMAIIGLFTAIATLGLNNIVVRDLVLLKSPKLISETLGTAFVLQVIGGGLACAIAVVAVIVMKPEDSLVRLIVTILGSSMVFKATEVIKYWFEAAIQSKYTVWVEVSAFLVFAAVKVGLILNAAPLIYFVWAMFLEAALVAILLMAFYISQGAKLTDWIFRLSRVKSLMHDAWPLILSGLAAMLYMRIDQIMLGQMLGDKSVGVYSAALRLSEVWYFIPIAIAGSVFPSIVEARERDIGLYYSRLKKLFDLMVLMAIAIALPISFSAGMIIRLLYGDGYNESANILVIHVWTGLFVFLGVASSRWFIAEGLQTYTFYRTLAGCLVNVVLNYFWIPLYGAAGAAWASVIAQAVASVFFNAVNLKTRHIFYMQMSSMIRLGLLREKNEN